MTPYEKYCTSMQERGLEPTMSEAQLHEAWGIKVVEEYTPFIARKSSSHKCINPTLENHLSPSSSCKEKKYINLMDAPRKSTGELLALLEKRIKDKKETLPKCAAGKNPQSKEAKERKEKRTKEWKEKKAQEFLAMGLTKAGIARTPRKPGLSKEETAKNRALNVKLKRAEFTAMGLTTRGVPFKQKKPKKVEKSIEELRVIRLGYAKTHKEKDYEAHLQYRRDLYRRNKESSNNTQLSQKVS